MYTDPILSDVSEYYSEKIRTHGPSPRGVDWNSPESQQLRFEQLLKICALAEGPSTLLDYGCGYGALLDYLDEQKRDLNLEYHGMDVSPAMIESAKELHADVSPETFLLGSETGSKWDYVIASGIFNVKQEVPNDQWHEYIKQTILKMAGMSRRGFAYNILTSYSDEDRKRPDLHYADPCWHFDWCKRTFSRHVSLLHDYGLYEFTILVKLDPKP